MFAILHNKLSKVTDNISASDFGIVISEKEYGISWPFKFDHVALMCPSKDMVVVYYASENTYYALTQAAISSGSGWENYHDALVPTASEAIIKSIIKRGLKICPDKY